MVSVVRIPNATGTPVRLADIAEIRLGPQMRRGIAELNGEGEVVGGVIVMRFGENALTTIKGVKKRLEELKKSLPEGVEIPALAISDENNVMVANAIHISESQGTGAAAAAEAEALAAAEGELEAVPVEEGEEELAEEGAEEDTETGEAESEE